MLKDYFEVPNKPAIKSGNVLSCDFTDHETFIPQPLDFTRNTLATYVDCNGIIKYSGVSDTELVNNGDFSDGLNGWSSHNGSILELQDGKAKVTTVGTQGWIKRTDLSIQNGKTYFCKAEITNALNPVFFINGTTNQLNPMPLISGNLYGGYITTTGNNSTFYIKGNNTDGEVSLIDNVSVREVDLNTPRIDYLTEIGKAKELQKPSLLLEPQSTNNYTYSSDFTQTYWLKQNGVTVSSNQTKSPEDVVNADKLISANATSEQYLNNTSISTTSGDDVTISCFVKKLDYDYFHIRFTATGGVWVAASVWYNISDGTVGTVEAGITAKIENYGNGWYRCSATRTATGTGSGRVRLQLASSDNTANVVGDGTKGTFIYGAQWEVGSYPTSYIPTSGSTVTRNVELCDNAGQRGVFNNEEGTMYVEFTELGFTNPNQTSIGVSQDSSSNNRLLLFRGGGANWAFQVRAASVNVVSNTIFTMTSPTTETLNNKFVKVAIRYKSGEITAFVNGSQTFTNSSTFTFNGELDKFGFIPYDGSTGNNFYGRVKDIKVFRRTLTDSEMAELTNNIT